MVDSRRPAFVLAEVGIGRAEDFYPIQKLRKVLLISLKERFWHLITLFGCEDGLELIVLRRGRSLEEMCDEADAFFGHSLAEKLL